MQHASLDSSGTSASVAFNSSTSAGGWIGVVIRAGAQSEAFTVTDTNGNTYRKAFQLNQTGDQDTLAVFYAENIAAGANTITVADTISATLRFAILDTGVATSNSLDVTVFAQGQSASPNSSNATTSSNGDLLLGAIMTANPASFSAGSGYTIEESVPAEPSAKLIAEDQIQTTAGSVSASATLGVSDFWAAGVAAFRPGGSAATPITAGIPISLVQHASLDSSGTSASVAFNSSNSAGGWIGVVIRAGAQSEAFTVTDTNGNTYRKAFQLNQTGDEDTLAVFYAENIAAGANTITVADTISATLRFAILKDTPARPLPIRWT